MSNINKAINLLNRLQELRPGVIGVGDVQGIAAEVVKLLQSHALNEQQFKFPTMDHSLTRDYLMTEGNDDWSCVYSDLGMYSGNRPASIVWQHVALGLIAKGCTKQQVEAYLLSKGARWALDGTLGNALARVAYEWGTKDSEVKFAKEVTP